MTTFAIGEVAILCGLVHFPELNGVECEVQSSLMHGPTINRATGELAINSYYMVCVRGEQPTAVKPYHLRKRRPPSTDESESRQAMLDCIERARRGCEVEA